MLISPNSVIGLPAEQKDGMSTTILQQAGSILLDVEKRNVKHFEVETPYLAAVVKGTHFQVTVNASSTRVDVQRGQVEVADFKTGQIAQVMPGQAATSFAHGKPGLSLSGSGTFNPIEQGKPRASTIQRVSVPRGGLHAPHGIGEGKSIRALGPARASPGISPNHSGPQFSRVNAPVHSNVIHLSTAIGEVHLNVQKATHGLAHSAGVPGVNGNASRDTARNTIWSDSNSTGSAHAVGTVNASGNGSSPSGAAASPASPAGSAVIAGTSSPGKPGNENGNGNGNGKGNGATGNGNNGHGNGGVGNGRGNGNAKH
jgi:hypothetical protein